MSELITRRTFLKTTGAAALAVAASGMLAGCGGAYASTPDGLVAAAVDSDKVVDFGAFTANIGRFDQWTSSSIYEGGERHNYLYAEVFKRLRRGRATWRAAWMASSACRGYALSEHIPSP